MRPDDETVTDALKKHGLWAEPRSLADIEAENARMTPPPSPPPALQDAIEQALSELLDAAHVMEGAYGDLVHSYGASERSKHRKATYEFHDQVTALRALLAPLARDAERWRKFVNEEGSIKNEHGSIVTIMRWHDDFGAENGHDEIVRGLTHIVDAGHHPERCPMPTPNDTPPPADAALRHEAVAVDARIAKAERYVSELCSGDRRWTMSIPARPDEDTDLVIGDALHEAQNALLALRARVAALEAQNEQLTMENDRQRAGVPYDFAEGLRRRAVDTEAEAASLRAQLDAMRGDGTPSARLNWVLDELHKLVGLPENNYSAAPPEIAYMQKVAALRGELAVAKKDLDKWQTQAMHITRDHRTLNAAFRDVESRFFEAQAALREAEKNTARWRDVAEMSRALMRDLADLHYDVDTTRKRVALIEDSATAIDAASSRPSSEASAPEHTEHVYTFRVMTGHTEDGEIYASYPWPKSSITGAELRALISLAPNEQLWLVEDSIKPDALVQEDTVIPLPKRERDAPKLYTFLTPMGN